MAAQAQGHIFNEILVQLDSPDGSTNWGHLINDILVYLTFQVAAQV